MTQMGDSVNTSRNGGTPLLVGLRILDLADERGDLCGRQFAELGADVIRIEPIDGCRSRRVGPFLDGVPGQDRSLHWISYQAGKRGVTLNLDTLDGQALFTELVRRADVVVESLGEQYFNERSIGYEHLSAVNPEIVYTTITPFGDQGPGASWKAADINCWAAGGAMYLTGVPGKSPLQISLPQAYLHAGAEAATASMLAHFQRLRDGHGQKVIVDTQACVAWTLMNEQGFPLLHGDFLERNGVMSGQGQIARKTVFECADGHVATVLTGGEPYAGSSRRIVEWMAEEGLAPEWLQAVDFSLWTPALFMNEPGPEVLSVIHRSEVALQDFLHTKTKAELYREALGRRILLAPVSSVKDIAEDEQLAARKYFRTVRHQAVDRDLVMPGAVVRYGGVPEGSVCAAPRIGEHNVEVYGELAEVSHERLRHLYSAGII